MANQTINLNFTPQNFQPCLYFSQGDVGRVFQINLLGIEIPSGATVTMQGTKPSGFGFTVEADSVSDGVALFTSTETMTAEAGRFPAEIHIASGSIEVGTANFLMISEKNPHPVTTIDGDAEEVIPELTLLVERVETAASKVLDMEVEAQTLSAGSAATYSYNEEENKATFGIPEGQAGAGAVGTVASAYSASKTYAVGDYAIQNGNLYRCTTAITTAESFTAAHWTQVVLGDDVTQLKSEINLFEDGFHDLNLFRYAELLYEDGYASIENGKISAKQSINGLNAYILPVDGESIYTFTMCRFAFLVDSDKETAIGSLLQNVTQIDSTGASYICFNINYNSYPISTYQVSKGNSLVSGFEPPQWFDDNIEPIADDVYSLKYDLGVNLFDKAILIKEGGYASIENGHIVLNNLSAYNAYLLPVEGKGVYNFTYCRFAFLVDADQYTAIGSFLEGVTQINCNNASYICFSFNKNSYPLANYEVVGKIDIEAKPKYASVSGDLSSGANLKLETTRNNLRKGERVVFEADISSFSSIRVGLSYTTEVGTDANQMNTFRIDGTNISYYARSNSTPITVPHNLTIQSNIQVIWEMTPTASCKITLISDGALFEHEFTGFVRQAVGNLFVLSVGSALTNCKLSWTCTDINKKIWMFGDSYFAYSSQRWTYYLHEYEYDKNALLDGFPGEGSVNGRVAFSNLLHFGTPKFAVWCLGMNDGGDSASAPSSDWVTQRDKFLQICENNDVTPIFGTIPTVPSINHEKKNEWIRSSGYRYIDFAKAVGANSSGVWYSGMLSDDNVHPTEQGARALFARVLLDLPEIMVSDFGY